MECMSDFIDAATDYSIARLGEARIDAEVLGRPVGYLVFFGFLWPLSCMILVGKYAPVVFVRLLDCT